MFWASLCPSSGVNTTCYCIWSLFAVTRIDADISRVVFYGDSVWFDKLGLLVCVCVAVSGWMCRSIVRRFVYLVRSGVWGLVPGCMYQSGWEVFSCRFTGWVIVVVEGRVIVGFVLHIRITYIPGNVGCGRLRCCGATLRV